MDNVLPLATAGSLLALAIVLSYLGIPFGKGMSTYIAFALLGGLSRSILRTITAVATAAPVTGYAAIAALEVTNTTQSPYFYMGIPIYDWVYFAIIGIGAVAVVLSQYKRSTSAMLQALVGYIAAMVIDYIVVLRFVAALGDGLRFLFLYDILARLISVTSFNVVVTVAQTILASVFGMAISPFSPAQGLAFGIAVTMAVIGFLLWIADLFHAYMSRLVQGFATMIAAGLEEGSWLIIATVALAIPMSTLVVSVYGLVYSAVIGLYIWLGAIVLALQFLKRTVDAMTIAAGGVIGQLIGSGVGGKMLRGALKSIGGKPFREAQAALFGNLVTIVAYIIGGTTMYPILVAIAVVMCLANAVTAARLIIGVPKRRISRYISAIYTLTLYAVTFKILAGWIGPAIIEYANQLDRAFNFLGILKPLIEQTPIGQFIAWVRGIGEALMQAAGDP